MKKSKESSLLLDAGQTRSLFSQAQTQTYHTPCVMRPHGSISHTSKRLPNSCARLCRSFGQRPTGKLSSMSDFLLLGQPRDTFGPFHFLWLHIRQGHSWAGQAFFSVCLFFGSHSPPPEGCPAGLAEDSDRAVSNRPPENSAVVNPDPAQAGPLGLLRRRARPFLPHNRLQHFGKILGGPISLSHLTLPLYTTNYKQMAFFPFLVYFCYFFHQNHLHLEFALFQTGRENSHCCLSLTLLPVNAEAFGSNPWTVSRLLYGRSAEANRCCVKPAILLPQLCCLNTS